MRGIDTKSIKEISGALVGTFDFQILAQQATKKISAELNLPACGIFRVDLKKKILRAYAFTASKNTGKVIQAMRRPFYDMTTPVDKPVNYLGQTVAFNKCYKGKRLRDFTVPTINSFVADLIQKLVNAKFLLSLPITNTNDNVIGVLLTSKSTSEFGKNEISTLKTFTHQLGLAMGNVIAHEKIIQEYKDAIELKNETKVPAKKQVGIKFTLRISKALEKYLLFKTANTKRSKAKFIREFLQDEIKKDTDFKEFKEIIT